MARPPSRYRVNSRSDLRQRHARFRRPPRIGSRMVFMTGTRSTIPHRHVWWLLTPSAMLLIVFAGSAAGPTSSGGSRGFVKDDTGAVLLVSPSSPAQIDGTAVEISDAQTPYQSRTSRRVNRVNTYGVFVSGIRICSSRGTWRSRFPGVNSGLSLNPLRWSAERWPSTRRGVAEIAG